mgnify:CR=1 FL=1
MSKLHNNKYNNYCLNYLIKEKKKSINKINKYSYDLKLLIFYLIEHFRCKITLKQLSD